MQNTDKWITNGYKKILKPQLMVDSETYDFGPQQKNYIKINELLNSIGHELTNMYVTYFSSKFHCTFVVESTLPGFMWHKYDSGHQGSGNNVVYYKNEKIKVTDFIKYTTDDLFKIIDDTP